VSKGSFANVHDCVSYVFRVVLYVGFHLVVIALYVRKGEKSRPRSHLTCGCVVNIVQLLNLLLVGTVLKVKRCLSQANVSILL
jgi:hypothetical protein